MCRCLYLSVSLSLSLSLSVCMRQVLLGQGHDCWQLLHDSFTAPPCERLDRSTAAQKTRRRLLVSRMTAICCFLTTSTLPIDFWWRAIMHISSFVNKVIPTSKVTLTVFCVSKITQTSWTNFDYFFTVDNLWVLVQRKAAYNQPLVQKNVKRAGNSLTKGFGTPTYVHTIWPTKIAMVTCVMEGHVSTGSQAQSLSQGSGVPAP